MQGQPFLAFHALSAHTSTGFISKDGLPASYEMVSSTSSLLEEAQVPAMSWCLRSLTLLEERMEAQRPVKGHVKRLRNWCGLVFQTTCCAIAASVDMLLFVRLGRVLGLRYCLARIGSTTLEIQTTSAHKESTLHRHLEGTCSCFLMKAPWAEL